MNAEAFGFVLAALLVLLQVWYHIRLNKVEAAARWILEHVRIVTPSQEDKGYAHIRKLFGIKDEE
jgi:hypothetical protein